MPSTNMTLKVLLMTLLGSAIASQSSLRGMQAKCRAGCSQNLGKRPRRGGASEDMTASEDEETVVHFGLEEPDELEEFEKSTNKRMKVEQMISEDAQNQLHYNQDGSVRMATSGSLQREASSGMDGIEIEAEFVDWKGDPLESMETVTATIVNHDPTNAVMAALHTSDNMMKQPMKSLPAINQAADLIAANIKGRAELEQQWSANADQFFFDSYARSFWDNDQTYNINDWNRIKDSVDTKLQLKYQLNTTAVNPFCKIIKAAFPAWDYPLTKDEAVHFYDRTNVEVALFRMAFDGAWKRALDHHCIVVVTVEPKEEEHKMEDQQMQE